MKKRIKITLRTKIYLTIVALLALTGIFYAANPIPFATLQGPVGVAAIPAEVFATQHAATKISMRSTAMGMSRCWRRSRVPVGPCVEKYLAVAPIQSAAAGFTPRDVFITQGADIYKFSGGIITPFATVGCPFSDHSSLTFDHEGTFGFKMIVTCENGPVWKVDGAGIVQPIARRGRSGSPQTLKDQL